MEQQTQTVSLPSSMRYAISALKAVSADTTLRQFASSNGSSFSTSVNEIRIPVSAHDGFLDASRSYLYFTIKNTNTATGENLQLDSDALCWVDSIRIESQGVLLERLDQAALWNNTKNRWDAGIQMNHARNALAGSHESYDGANNGLTIDEVTSHSFCCRLPVGFLNGHHGRAIPAGSQFDIILRVNPKAESCFKWEKLDKYGFTIENPRFYCPMYRIENREVMSEYASVLSTRGISWTGNCVKTYISALNTGAQTTSLQINDRSKSLKGLVSCKRVTADITDRAKNSQSDTNITGVTQVAYMIQGRTYPQDHIQVSPTDYSRLYEECAKAMSTNGNIRVGPQVLGSAFKPGSSTRGMMGVDLKRFDDLRLVDVGIDTTGGAPNVLEITTDGGHNANSQVSTFAICDCTWTLQPNGVITASM